MFMMLLDPLNVLESIDEVNSLALMRIYYDMWLNWILIYIFDYMSKYI